jgi:membrane-associated phospholipid phosphatase
VPWLDTTAGTPPHPEYPSGHSTVSGAAAFVLAHVFGDETAFTVTSEARPGTRSFASFSAALAEINDARVFAGIHFRTSCVRANALGATVARYVLTHAMRADDEDEH